MKECLVSLWFMFIYFSFLSFHLYYQCHCLNRENSENCPIKVVQNKNASVWNWTRVTAHPLYHRVTKCNDDLFYIYSLSYHKNIRYFIGNLFKSQFDSLISIYKHGCIRNMHECQFQGKWQYPTMLFPQRWPSALTVIDGDLPSQWTMFFTNLKFL